MFESILKDDDRDKHFYVSNFMKRPQLVSFLFQNLLNSWKWDHYNLMNFFA